MGNSSNTLTRERLEQMWNAVPDEGDKLDILFLMGLDSLDRIRSLEKRKRFDTTISGITGVAGGIVAMVSKWFFWK